MDATGDANLDCDGPASSAISASDSEESNSDEDESGCVESSWGFQLALKSALRPRISHCKCPPFYLWASFVWVFPGLPSLALSSPPW